MSGSAVFLLAALKMRLGMAARRCGVGAEAGRVIGWFEAGSETSRCDRPLVSGSKWATG
jgi:hypothetical protein